MSAAVKCDGCQKYGEAPDAYSKPMAWLHVERQGVRFADEAPEMDFCSSKCCGEFFLKCAEAGR